MRILYLHQYFNTPAMSGGTRSYEMGRRFVAAGHEVHVITSDRAPRPGARGWRETDEAGMRVHWLPVPYANAMSHRRRLRAFAEFAWGAGRRAVAVGGDVVLATSTPLTIALPGAWASARLKVPMVFEVRDLWPELPIALGILRGPGPVAAARWLERFAYRRAERVIALSDGMKEGVVASGFPPDRVTVIPNSSDLDLFDVPADRGLAVRDRYAWLGRRPLIIYAGALGAVNAVDWVVDLATQVKDLDPEIRFMVVGSGREEAAVRSKAAAKGILEQNFFLLPEVPKREMPDLLSAADLALSTLIDLPVLWASSPNKMFDAFAAGRPVVVNHGGWRADLVRTTGCGLVLPYGDASESARMLVSAIRDPDWMARAGSAARRLARGPFSRDKLAASMQAVLETAVEGRTAARPRRGRRAGLALASRRILDIVGSVAALLLASPLLLAVALLVRWRLGRPVLFRQQRPGLHGRPFTIVKFRTMRDARDSAGRLLPDAQRLTGLGRFLRASSIDELPELLNVLRGEMSLIGPRPLLPEYLPLYDARQGRRHEVKPGLTGWAQVRGRNAVGWPERLEMDVWYVENRSLLLDLRILLETPLAVLSRRGIGHGGEDTMPRFQGGTQ